MIRINLKTERQTSKDLGSIKAGGNLLRNLDLSNITLDAASIVLMIVVLSLFLVPHLMFLKYSEHVIDENKKKLSAIQAEDESLTSEIAKFQTYQTEMKSIEEQESKIAQRLSVLNQLQASRVGPVNILDSLGQSLPQRVWLTNIELNLGELSQAQITGRGYSSEDVSEFVDKLNSSIYFEKVNLDSVSTQKEGDQIASVKSFLIVAALKRTGNQSRTVANEPSLSAAKSPKPQKSN
jgi:Tfp pilus assembly protein PilN